MVDVSSGEFQGSSAATLDPNTGAVAGPKGTGTFVSPDDFAHSPSLGRKAAASSTDSIPGGSDATTAFMHHLVANLPGGEDIGAALEAPFTGKSVTEQKHDIQARGAQQWEEHPWASGAGVGASIIGQAAALPVAGPEELLAGGITKLAPAFADYAPALARTGVGAGYGSIYGGTSGPDLWDTSGAVPGAVIGGAGAAIAPLISRAGGAAARWAGFGDAGGEAAQKIKGAFEADQPGGGALNQAGFAKAQAAKQSPMAADLGGENVRELADEAALNSPTARTILKGAADVRYAGQQDRFGDFMDGSFPGHDLNTATQRDEINLAAKQANSTAYNAAYGDPRAQAVWSDDLANLMRDPNVQSAIPKAQSKAASAAVAESAQGRTVPIPQNPFIRDADGNWDLRRDAQGNATIPGLKWWDYVNRSLGDQVSAARRAGNMDDARVVGGIQRQLQGALDQQVPPFAQARATAAGFFNESNLVDAAVKFDKTKDEGTINTMLKDLSQRDPEDQEVFARAYAAQLKQRGLTPGGQADIVKQFNKPYLATKIRAALNTPSNPNRAQEMEAWMLREQAFNTLRDTFGNSKTAQRWTAQAKHGEGHGLVGQIAQSFGAPGGGAISGAALAYEGTPHESTWGQTFRNMGEGAAAGAFTGWMAQRRGTVNAETWNEIARQLASNNPNIYEDAVKRVARRPQFMQSLRNALRPLAPRPGTVLPSMAGGVAASPVTGGGPFSSQ